MVGNGHDVVAEIVQDANDAEDFVQAAPDQPTPALQGEWKTVRYYTGPNETLGKKGQLHGQAAQDWLVSTLLGCKDKGFFVDLAAADGLDGSNTLMLERDFGWNGICIDPQNQYLYSLAKRNCKIATAAVGSPRNHKVNFSLGVQVGGIVGEEFDNHEVSENSVELQTVPLGDLLEAMDAPKHMDYLSLDVEGAESMIMQNFPWDTYSFAVISVERPKPDLVQNLEIHGYKFVTSAYNTWGDQIWVSNHLSDRDETKEIAAWSPSNSSLPASCMTKWDGQYKLGLEGYKLVPQE